MLRRARFFVNITFSRRPQEFPAQEIQSKPLQHSPVPKIQTVESERQKYVKKYERCVKDKVSMLRAHNLSASLWKSVS